MVYEIHVHVKCVEHTPHVASFPVFPAPAFFAAVEKNGAGKPGRKHHVMSSTTYVTPKTTQSLT